MPQLARAHAHRGRSTCSSTAVSMCSRSSSCFSTRAMRAARACLRGVHGPAATALQAAAVAEVAQLHSAGVQLGVTTSDMMSSMATWLDGPDGGTSESTWEAAVKDCLGATRKFERFLNARNTSSSRWFRPRVREGGVPRWGRCMCECSFTAKSKLFLHRLGYVGYPTYVGYPR